MSAVIALVAFIAVIIVWNVVVKRNIGEAMIIGWVVTSLFAGWPNALIFGLQGLRDALTEPTTFAALAFVFVSEVLARAGMIQRLVDILSSLLGRVPGGSAYAATASSGLFATVAHSGAAIVATIGSITIPWMKRSKTSGETAALVMSGNAGLGTTFPFAAAFFILLASPTVAPSLKAPDVVSTMFITGAWMVVMRLIITAVIVRKRGVGRMDEADIQPLKLTLVKGWTSLLIFVGIAIPVMATVGFTGEWVRERVGEDAAGGISLLLWLPIIILILGLFIGRKTLPRSTRAWWQYSGEVAPKLGIVGITMVFAFAASNVLTSIGLAEQLGTLMEVLDGVPKIAVVAVVGLILVVIAGPLNSASTTAAVGPIAFAALTAAGVPAAVAFAIVLVFASSEGASPPGAAPLYVAAGIAEVNPVRIFLPVVMYYLIPTFIVGVLIGVGVLWIPTP
ncbi:TRAP transporter large permease subunit [Arthrobacter ruber]|uniref:TRAP transporter large permease subunit n=1 Tax=Arthrobacter ruber TaxID=1258893 RepID=UPI000CF49597|nr:TRAP transporter large permease subunit [Arthrobacter ruber]